MVSSLQGFAHYLGPVGSFRIMSIQLSSLVGTPSVTLLFLLPGLMVISRNTWSSGRNLVMTRPHGKLRKMYQLSRQR